MAKKRAHKDGWKPDPNIYDPFSTRIRRALKEKLKAYCHRTDLSKQHVVNEALREYLKKREG